MKPLGELAAPVIRRADTRFRAGEESLEYGDYLSEFVRQVDVEPLEDLMNEAMSRFDDPVASDGWLAPRVHHALRLSRREASRSGVWLFLGLVTCAGYVRWRWSKPGRDDEPDLPAGLDRFAGPDHKHAVARLWWMSELFRDGPDYGPVVISVTNQDVPNNLFRMDIAHHRPTVQGFARVLASGPHGKPLTGRQANALAKAANSAATTLLLDVLAPDVRPSLIPEATERWIATPPDVIRYLNDAPEGPDDPKVPPTSVDAAEQLMRELLVEAPVRGK